MNTLPLMFTANDYKPGTQVRSTYRGEWTGEVLALNDVRSWAGTMAVEYSAEPTQAEVDQHVEHCLSRGLLQDSVPVLWEFGKVYHEQPENLIEL